MLLLVGAVSHGGVILERRRRRVESPCLRRKYACCMSPRSSLPRMIRSVVRFSLMLMQTVQCRRRMVSSESNRRKETIVFAFFANQTLRGDTQVQEEFF